MLKAANANFRSEVYETLRQSALHIDGTTTGELSFRKSKRQFQ